MITGELKNKIDSIWEIFWTGGLTSSKNVQRGSGVGISVYQKSAWR